MLGESDKKRVIAFFDCQNLFKASESLWGYSYPNFDPIKLSKHIVKKKQKDSWQLAGIRLYTGIHDKKRSPQWHHFWNQKLSHYKKADTRVF